MNQGIKINSLYVREKGKERKGRKKEPFAIKLERKKKKKDKKRKGERKAVRNSKKTSKKIIKKKEKKKKKKHTQKLHGEKSPLLAPPQH